MTSKNENETPAPADIQAARDWCESRRFHSDPSGLHSDTLLRALTALEREPQWQEGIDALYRDRDEFKADRDQWRAACQDARIERDNSKATLASCDRARRAAEEECARLRGVVDDSDLRAIAAHNDVVALCADRDRLAADNAELEAALAAQREALKSCVDGENRLAALVARVRALVDSGHGVDADVSLVAVSRALEGEVK